MAGKKILFVLPPHRFDGAVYWAVRRALEMRGDKITVTSVVLGSIVADDGPSAPVNLEIRDLKTYEYDAVIFMGGEGTRYYFDEARVLKLADEVKFKVLGATGNATVVLAMADLLKGKTVTGASEYADLVVRRGAKYTGQPMEVDDRIVTLREPAVAEYFANAIAKALGE